MSAQLLLKFLFCLHKLKFCMHRFTNTDVAAYYVHRGVDFGFTKTIAEDGDRESPVKNLSPLFPCTCVVLVLHQPPLRTVPMVGQQQVGGVSDALVICL